MVGCASPLANINYGGNSPEAKAAIEASIRNTTKKREGELTKADLRKATHLAIDNRHISDLIPLAKLKQLKEVSLRNNEITDLSPLAGLKNLKALSLQNNPNLTKAELAKLQKALPNCKIISDPVRLN